MISFIYLFIYIYYLISSIYLSYLSFILSFFCIYLSYLMPVSISITDTTQIVHEIQIYMHTHHIRPPSRLQDIFPGPGESQLGPPKFGLETLRAIMSKGQNMMNLFKKEKVDHASLQTFFHSKPAQNIYIWYGKN